MSQEPQIKVAVIHDWLTGMRGGELCLEAILQLFPSADVFTLLHVKGAVSESIESHRIYTSWLQKIPRVDERYRHFLPLMPMTIESFDLSTYDLVISSSHCVAKGVKKHPEACHVSYVYAPMRYMWDRFDDYFSKQKSSWITRFAAHLLRPFLRSWDRASSQPERIDALMGISRFIVDRIKDSYARDATVVHPFADLGRYRGPRKSEDFFLMVGAFAPYKRVDLAVDVFNELGLPLKIVGTGQDERIVKSRAGRNIEFLGYQTDEQIADWYSRCRAFVFPGLEDFGITPL
jgi:glycosyltransferase involved in cell wall biosynthesis